MNRDDIIHMARDCGMTVVDDQYSLLPFLERFAALVAAAEREACAKVCEEYENDMGYGQPQKCADAIRARGQE